MNIQLSKTQNSGRSYSLPESVSIKQIEFRTGFAYKTLGKRTAGVKTVRSKHKQRASVDYLLVLVEENGAGPVRWHLRTPQPGPQVLIRLLYNTESWQNQVNIVKLLEVPNDRTEKIYEPWRLRGVDLRQKRPEANSPQRQMVSSLNSV